MSELPDFDPDEIPAEERNKKLFNAAITRDLESRKVAAAAAANARAADRDLTLEHTKADIAATADELTKELELRNAFHEKLLEIGGASIERARDSAKFVQTAAAAILTAYAGLLGLVFSVQDRPLPLRGVYAAVFLGLAVALAVGYLAFIRQGPPVRAYKPRPSIAGTQLARTASFLDWTNNAVGNRRTALRAAVVAFGLGIAFIPAPFVGATGGSIETATAGAATPPAIPEAVSAAFTEDAVRLFRRQVDAYVEATTEDDGATGSVTSCSGHLETFQGCAWTTELGVERAFRRTAVVALGLVVVVPSAFLLVDWVGNRRRRDKKSRGRRSPEPATASG